MLWSFKKKGMSDMQAETNKIAYRIDEAVKASGLGRTFLYERIASGELKSVKVRGRRLIFHTDLMDFLKRAASV
jgi:excisionase family DNA binding protein